MTRINRQSPGKPGKIKVQQGPDVSTVDNDTLPPVFALDNVQVTDCITDCTKDDKAAFADTLRRLSQLPWRELRYSHRHGLGFEKIDHNAINRPLPSCVTAEVALLACRFSGMKPMVGYRENRTFHILWIDDNFDVYNH